MNFNHLPINSRIRIGFDIFLFKAREKHGVRFLYDRSSWQGTNGKVRVCCSRHGWFEQVADDHLRKQGCYKCAKEESWVRIRRRGWRKFIASAKLKYGDKYEYDATSWSGIKTKLRIFCPEHGWFTQVPFDHLKTTTGCTKCGHTHAGLAGRLSKEEVVNRLKAVHGGRYSYEKISYHGRREPLEIVCEIHGSFFQKFEEHEKGNGCQKCSKRHRWTTAEFISNSMATHGDKFTYKRAHYTGALSPIVVTCRKHGDFSTQPARHIQRKDGCPQCNPRSRKSLEYFLEKANKRFGSKYDYSLVQWNGIKNPVKIICPHHGIFEQPPGWHLNNSVGCPSCSYSVSNKEIAWLDSINLPSTAKRQAKVLLGSRRRNVDAFDPATNTVYEFWGDWWHGHPDYFPPKAIHPIAKVAYADLYRKTMEKRQLILKSGYTLVEIWEHDYDAQVSSGQMAKPAGRLTKRKPIKRARTGIS